ncbi:MAG: bifunctional 4-hydroxy-2-oxoglutarate aldolase/2-dehydro-3-deoxy-phosphogluconate aldolase [Opitutales bacterium]
MSFAETLSWSRLVPVAVLDRVEDALPLVDALAAAGLNLIEVTLRTPAALDAIRQIRSERPDFLVGAGTVLDPETVPQLADLGVRFVVSPGINPQVVESCHKAGLPVTPGVITPTEVEQGRALGCDVLKFFPAEAMGGARVLKALAGPYGHTGLKFIPTGGINADKARDYWALPAVAAVGGSWFVDKKLVASGDFAAITRLTAEALQAARG